jgi:formylglycine-generating enzyme required for sulfatase activity
MPFDINTWKAQLSAKLPGWRARMHAGGVNSVYYFIAASSLFPVLQAAQSGDWSALVSLGTILGSAVSTNLLANLAKKLKDKTDVEVAEILQSGAQLEPDLKAEIDALLDKLDALKQAELVLSEEDQRWFAIIIQQELAQNKSGIVFSAKIIGNGTIAQGDGAIAVGEGGIYVGGNFSITNELYPDEEQKNKEALARLAKEKDELVRRYLEWVAAQANLVPWTKVTTDFADPSRGESLQLADVYIDLDTNKMQHMLREEELREFLAHQHTTRISAQEMVSTETKLLIMGDPGSGKSTFVKHITYLMAQARLAQSDPAPWLERLRYWKHGALLPVRVELRQLLAGASSPAKGARLLLNYLHTELRDWGLDAYWEHLQNAIQVNDGGVLFLLDGLDEVPTNQRQAVVDAVNELSAIYDKNRYVVTCRPYAYIGQPWILLKFHEVTLAPFSEAQIDAFVDNWYARLAERGRIEKHVSDERARRLKEAVRRSDLQGLAERPLLLTVMAQLHAYAGQLPEDRTQLYADAMQLLLQRWESRLSEQSGILEYLNIPGLKMSDLETGLYYVAYRAHSASVSQEGTADITEGQLREWLCRYLNNDWNKAGEFVNYIRERAGLLVRHKIEAYTFPHRSFQEFLAACYWLSMEDYPAQAAALTHADWERWHEVFVLAAGYAARTKRLGQAIAAVNALLPRAVSEVSHPQQNDWRTALLAVQALLEIGLVGVHREDSGQALLERMHTWLVASIGRNQDLKPIERAEAGRVLAKLGDPRTEIISCEHMRFCQVLAGSFLYGEEIRKVDLPDDFWMGKYPITNAQYRQFVASSGYSEARFWQEAIKENYWEMGKFKGRYDDKFRSEAVDYGEPFNLSNHPVVGVTWYEAQAFVCWLSEQLPVLGVEWSVEKGADETVFRQGLASKKLDVFLPDEVRWEKAACGTDGRNYPWGENADPNRANYDETRINTTNTVGCFPGGMSPSGVLELSGNVWEWTSTRLGAARVFRGGSFDNNSDNARCAARNWDDPDSVGRDRGFRVMVVSPEHLSRF